METQTESNMANRYRLAKEKILMDLPVWRKKELVEMETTGQRDHRRYTEFTQQVIELAESDKEIFLTT